MREKKKLTRVVACKLIATFIKEKSKGQSVIPIIQKGYVALGTSLNSRDLLVWRDGPREK